MLKTAEDHISINPLMTGVTKPTPNGNMSLAIGARTEVYHSSGSLIIKGAFVAANTRKITASERSIFCAPSVLYIRIR